MISHLQLYISGKVAAPLEVGTTKKGKEWIKLVLEVPLVREIRAGELQNELTILPMNCFSREAAAVRNLRQGDKLTVGAHLQGTCFKPADGPPKYGLQLVVDEVLAAGAVARQTLKEGFR